MLAVAAAALGWLLNPVGGEPEVHRTATERYVVRLVVPAQGGEQWAVEVDGRDGRPAAVSGVRLEPVMTGMGHALEPVPARPDGVGRHRADVVLPMSGAWEVTVRLHDAAGGAEAVFTVLR